MESEIASLRAQLNKSEGNGLDARASCSNLRKELDDLKVEFVRLRQRHLDMENQNNDLSAKITLSTTHANSLEEKVQKQVSTASTSLGP